MGYAEQVSGIRHGVCAQRNPKNRMRHRVDCLRHSLYAAGFRYSQQFYGMWCLRAGNGERIRYSSSVCEIRSASPQNDVRGQAPGSECGISFPFVGSVSGILNSCAGKGTRGEHLESVSGVSSQVKYPGPVSGTSIRNKYSEEVSGTNVRDKYPEQVSGVNVRGKYPE